MLGWKAEITNAEFNTEWGLGWVRTARGIGSAPSDAITKVEVDPLTGKFDPCGKKNAQFSPLAQTIVDNNNLVYSGWVVTLKDDGRMVATPPSGYVYTQEGELTLAAQMVIKMILW